MKIKIIEQRGAAALVEWSDSVGLHRAVVPQPSLSVDKDGAGEPRAACALAELQQGIPFGMAFENLEIGTVGAAEVARELHARGVWTAEDVLKHVAGVRAALQAAYSKDLETILNAARASRNTFSRAAARR